MRPALFVLSLVFLAQGFARLENSICGTHRDRQQEELHLHRYATATRKTLALGFAGVARDIGEIAIIEDSDGVVARRNVFNLDGRTIHFAPLDLTASRYRFQNNA